MRELRSGGVLLQPPSEVTARHWSRTEAAALLTAREHRGAEHIRLFCLSSAFIQFDFCPFYFILLSLFSFTLVCFIVHVLFFDGIYYLIYLILFMFLLYFQSICLFYCILHCIFHFYFIVFYIVFFILFHCILLYLFFI